MVMILVGTLLIMLLFLLFVLSSQELELMLTVIALPIQLLMDLEAVIVSRQMLIGINPLVENASVSKQTTDG